MTEPGTTQLSDGSNRARMPEVDWLTGLASRDAFARQVNQADRDGDRLAIAVLGLADFGIVNRLLGYDAGDDLLRLIGRTLGEQTSMTTIAGRLDGARFGLLDLQTEDGQGSGEQLRRWLGPVVESVRIAISGWAFEQHDFGAGAVVAPELLVGTADGYGGRVWVEATIALETAEGQPGGPTVVTYDETDRRIRDRRRRDRTVEMVTEAMARGRLTAVGVPIVGTDPRWAGAGWIRLDAAAPDRRRSAPPLSDLALPDDLAGRVQGWLIDEAIKTLGRATGQVRLTVPFRRLPVRARSGPGADGLLALGSLLRTGAVPASRILLEIDEPAAIRLTGEEPDLGPLLHDLGTAVVLAGCDGGWRTIKAAADLPVAYLRPSADLAGCAAAGNRAAVRVLAGIAADAADHDRELVSPPALDTTTAAALGFAYAELDGQRPAAELVQTASG